MYDTPGNSLITHIVRVVTVSTPGPSYGVTSVDLSAFSSQRRDSLPLRGHLVRPEGPGPWSGTVLIPEIFGPNDAMRRHAERLTRTD